MADTVKVRLKMTPWKETVIRGGQRELDELKTRGLVYEGQATTDEGAVRAVEREQAAAKKTTG